MQKTTLGVQEAQSDVLGRFVLLCMFLHSPENEHEFHGPWVHDYRYRTQDFPKECFQKPIWAPELRWSLLQQKAGRIMSLPIGIWRDSWNTRERSLSSDM